MYNMYNMYNMYDMYIHYICIIYPLCIIYLHYINPELPLIFLFESPWLVPDRRLFPVATSGAYRLRTDASSIA